MWKLDHEEGYFRVYDSRRTIAGYFDPDYGPLPAGDEGQDVVDRMIRDGDPVPGGTLMVPLIKFGLFDTDLDAQISDVEASVGGAAAQLARWRRYLADAGGPPHSVRISHTDQDMLTISFPVYFKRPVPVSPGELLGELGPVLDDLQGAGLL